MSDRPSKPLLIIGFTFISLLAVTATSVLSEALHLPNLPNGLLLLGIFLLAGIASLMAWLLEKNQQEAGEATQSLSLQTPEDWRQALRPAIANEVTERREQALHNFVAIDLLATSLPEQVGRPRPLPLAPEDAPGGLLSHIVRLGGFAREEKKPELTAKQAFEEIEGNLLVFGMPGAGKTTTLLELAAELFKATEANAELPLPIVVELSDWKEKKGAIADWLAAYLRHKNHVPPKVTFAWLEKGQIFPLFDGLDEMAVDAQQACIEELNEFRKKYPLLRCVVCCRLQEYRLCEKQLQLKGAILLKALKRSQVRDYLKELKRESIWNNLQQNRDLLRLARIPLFLNLLVAAYQGKAIETREQLFETYIERRLELQARERNERYDREETLCWLDFLAQKLRQEREAEFLLERIQPSWLESKQEKLMFKLIFGLAVGSTVWLITWLFLSPMSFLGPVFGPLLPLLFGFFAGLNSALAKQIQPPVKILRWSWKDARFNLIVGFILFSIGGFTSKSFLVLVGVPIFGAIGGIAEDDLQTRSRPSQGMAKTLQQMFTFSVLTAFLWGALFAIPALVENTGFGPAVQGASLGLMMSFSGGGIGTSVIGCVILRWMLWRRKRIPWNYLDFLDYATELRFLQRACGRYRFAHYLLREHFANLQT